MHRAKFLLIVFALLTGLVLLSALDAAIRSQSSAARLALMAQQVRQLTLTDLSLFTEARYTRHLTQADRHSPMQEHPLAFEHFPSGSLVPPPLSLRVAR